MPPKPEPPDWESFEPYTGETEKTKLRLAMERGFHVFMVTLGLAVVFGLGGVAGFLLPYLSRVRSSNIGLGDTGTFAWIRFGIGGTIGVVWILMRYLQKPRA